MHRPGPILMGMLALATLFSCGDDRDNGTGPLPGQDFTAILDTYVDQTVIATYADLDLQAAELSQAVQAFSTNPSQGNLDAAAQQWIDTREPWEASEGFLFGPVAFLALDPSLDSWPLDQAQLEEVLASGFALTPDFIRDGLNAALRGFHTVEFLLFRDGQPRTAGSVTAREREYLVAVTQVLADDAALLHEAWTDAVEGVGPRAFGEEFKGAGQVGSRYLSQAEAVLEMIEGMIVIADEVGNGKINDPYTQQDPAIVESWFSWNSLTDFTNNVRSIQNVYLGGYHKGTRSTGLASFVDEEDPALDARIRTEIQAAIDAIGQIPAPFRNNLGAGEQIEAARTALNTLVATFENDLKAAVQGQS